MALLKPLKSLLLSVFRLLKGVLAQDLADRSEVTFRRIGAIERGEVQAPAAELEQILTAMGCSKAEVIIVWSCLEALHDLNPAADPEAAAANERFIASSGRHLRRRLRASGVPDPSAYPGPHEVELDRFEARDSWERLLPVKTLAEMTLVVRVAREYPCWAFVERLCDESVRAASKDPRRALDLAIVAGRIARRLPVWELWRLRLLGFAAAHLANALRVINRLDAADRTLAAARRLWAAGLDPDRLLDPGRLLDLEASLRRDQRRFPEALDLLEQAAPLTRRPEHVGLKLASVLAVMGRYHRAIEALTELGPRVAAHPESRLKSIQRFNLCVALSHVGRHARAAKLLPVLGRLVKDDEMDRIRFRWLEGRISAGLGQTREALEALDEARSGFIHHGLGYDVALSLLETAALHLERGELGEVQRLTAELAPFFEENGVHDEALKALGLFEEAAARQAATAELARLLLAWLFRAQHDRGLVFSPPTGSP
jgi:tetratricopeptide (TPR) repeat protein/transcriptional regulator with XRE-family HTH domain